jgi:NAD-dependent SIR2 family protein deacetylase
VKTGQEYGMAVKTEIWCDRDEHKLYEHFVDFNDWLESEDGAEVREENRIDGISQPSKAFFAGDKEAYDQAFREYREERRNEVLNKTYLCEQFTDDHWFQRNLDHFKQLVQCLKASNVVPFAGAGLSVAGGFPSWKDHLRQQGRTAGIDQAHIEDLLANGQYETVIEEIENKKGRDVFTQEIRDVFSRTGEITDTTLRLTELFTDTVITTNYDRLIEQAFDTGEENAFQVINGMNALEKPAVDRVSIVKLHGDIQNPARCILSKNQYDQAYGTDQLDMTLPIPKLLSYYFRNSSLLFLGCSLNNDRTMQVFQAVKDEIGDADKPQHFSIEQAPEDEQELVNRNAHLARLGITAIWFEKGCFDYVENMLSLARNELRYRGAMPGTKKAPKLNEQIIEPKGAGLIAGIITKAKSAISRT